MIHFRSWLKLIKIGPKLWPPECSQGFSMIWPTDLVFDLVWPIFKLDRDIVKMIILSKFVENWTWTVVSKVFTMSFYDLTYWPRFWPGMIHFRSSLKLIKIGPKLWPPEFSKGFCMIWPTDLVFDLVWPIFKLDRDIVKMIILSKFVENWTWTVVSKVFTMFFYDLIYWPSFWPDMIHIQSWSSIDEDWTKTVAARVFKRFFYDLTYWPSFLRFLQPRRKKIAILQVAFRKSYLLVISVIVCYVKMVFGCLIKCVTKLKAKWMFLLTCGDSILQKGCWVSECSN